MAETPDGKTAYPKWSFAELITFEIERRGKLQYEVANARNALVDIRSYAAASSPPVDLSSLWQPIETATKGSWLEGPNNTRHPDYIKPPKLLLWTEDGPACGYADAYYAEGGSGYDGGSFWVETHSGERIRPTHWMPLPAPPRAEG